jgi:hypothetical protein
VEKKLEGTGLWSVPPTMMSEFSKPPASIAIMLYDE